MRIFTQNDSLVIEFHGAEIFWALKKRIVIPFESLTSLELHETWQWPTTGTPLRTGGTFVPKTLMAGRYQVEGQQYFAYVHLRKRSGFNEIQADSVAVITTHDYPYTQIFVSVENPDQLPKL
jgi:hypothetical protein